MWRLYDDDPSIGYTAARTRLLEEIAMTLSDELSKLAELRERGTLTEEEFARAKARLLTAETPAGAPPFVSAVNTLRRSRGDRWLAGVCGGLGRSTGMEAWVWRLLFAILFLFGGAGLLVYVLMAIFVPIE